MSRALNWISFRRASASSPRTPCSAALSHCQYAQDSEAIDDRSYRLAHSYTDTANRRDDAHPFVALDRGSFGCRPRHDFHDAALNHGGTCGGDGAERAKEVAFVRA